MLRHPQNTNLHIHADDLFEGLPVMIEKGPFVTEYLVALKRTIDLTLNQYSRVFAFRVDLRLPTNGSAPGYACTNAILNRFLESFKAKIKHNRYMARQKNKYAHECTVRYVWAREIGRNDRPHYHLLFLLNHDAFYTLGRINSDSDNMYSRLNEAWASALGLSLEAIAGLVHVPENPVYRLHRDNLEAQRALFYRASYLCKSATKRFGDGNHGFGHSRG
ncbi:TPA: inovirus Gp2 family protein [Pseudomonas aeruginosa]|uniref:inovirus Gp2 family protein n=1 Tax=Pseudomonas aeruginosa group TaxID=136841 RepID=UPI0008FB83ED|nr:MULTISPECIES: inovirus Gp2 family protein [Pseudomonas aeruginosa group]EIZ0545106.1 inovirus Gp2 family protein [Pseudomonas aeruginosa]EKV0214832.1 inovirus Gp2 family protein [Pseudomonas aeruginosa]EKV0397213.1 inovirus Gp2 family protein [Pseudomonas aeruginosa]EKV3012826.1 inovirus Gp2 family protein [Pseudomonas aeruginosa]EKV4131887.1 inovirus Gp2 family protein [Pseudomonas aeruginosa]